VAEGQLAFLPNLIEPGTVAYRSIWRHTRGDVYGRMAAIPTAIEIRKQFPFAGPPPSTDALRQLIDANYHSDPKPTGLIALYVAEELAPFYALPEAEPDLQGV